MADEKCKDCAPALRIEELQRENENHKNRIDNHSDRLRELEINNTKEIYGLNEAIKRLEATVITLGQTVESLKYKPVKRFDNIIDTIIAVVITAAVTYFLAKK